MYATFSKKDAGKESLSKELFGKRLSRDFHLRTHRKREGGTLVSYIERK